MSEARALRAAGTRQTSAAGQQTDKRAPPARSPRWATSNAVTSGLSSRTADCRSSAPADTGTSTKRLERTCVRCAAEAAASMSSSLQRLLVPGRARTPTPRASAVAGSTRCDRAIRLFSAGRTGRGRHPSGPGLERAGLAAIAAPIQRWGQPTGAGCWSVGGGDDDHWPQRGCRHRWRNPRSRPAGLDADHNIRPSAAPSAGGCRTLPTCANWSGMLVASPLSGSACSMPGRHAVVVLSRVYQRGDPLGAEHDGAHPRSVAARTQRSVRQLRQPGDPARRHLPRSGVAGIPVDPELKPARRGPTDGRSPFVEPGGLREVRSDPGPSPWPRPRRVAQLLAPVVGSVNLGEARSTGWNRTPGRRGSRSLLRAGPATAASSGYAQSASLGGHVQQVHEEVVAEHADPVGNTPSAEPPVFAAPSRPDRPVRSFPAR